MFTLAPLRAPHENRILAALPHAEYERLSPHLERVHLPQGKVLCEAGDHVRRAYFVTKGMVSLISISEDGRGTEVGMVGNEGMMGLPIILRGGISPYRNMVQITGEALSIKAEMLMVEFNRNPRFQDLLLRYTHAVLIQVSQSAVCNRFHTVDARLSRWLLVTRDRIQSDSFKYTQELISYMLGTPRTVVTTAANKLQDAGFIRYRRGHITILNLRGLESSSCECYRVALHYKVKIGA
ncbi:MAG TPA: Crp/Fnr family transcriptional regulator [Pyrinomonadaceae bacterium]|nr:Crp/Fnr family transcriptional regulator [Pyrinomonadaceae bacterium]